MTADQPEETITERLAREGADFHHDMTRHAETYPPEAAPIVLGARDITTDMVALVASYDARISDMEREQEQVRRILSDPDLIAATARANFTPEQRAEIARRITEP